MYERQNKTSSVWWLKSFRETLTQTTTKAGADKRPIRVPKTVRIDRETDGMDGKAGNSRPSLRSLNNRSTLANDGSHMLAIAYINTDE